MKLNVVITWLWASSIRSPDAQAAGCDDMDGNYIVTVGDHSSQVAIKKLVVPKPSQEAMDGRGPMEIYII